MEKQKSKAVNAMVPCYVSIDEDGTLFVLLPDCGKTNTTVPPEYRERYGQIIKQLKDSEEVVRTENSNFDDYKCPKARVLFTDWHWKREEAKSSAAA